MWGVYRGYVWCMCMCVVYYAVYMRVYVWYVHVWCEGGVCRGVGEVRKDTVGGGNQIRF